MSTVDFEDPMAFGMGLQSLQLKARGVGVIGDAPSPASIAQTVQFALLKIDTYDDYQKAFGFDADASASYGLFHGSAKFNFAEKHSYTSFSRYLVASITVTNEFQQLANPKLSTSANALLAAGHPDRFYEEFGDSFVLGITTGGAYYAVLEFTSESEADLHNISAALEVGEYGLFSGQAEFSSAVQRFKGQTSLIVNSLQLGGTDTTQAVNVDDILAKAANFAPEVRQSATKFSAFLQDYKALDLPDGPNPVDIENARLVLQNYTPLRNQLVQKLNEIEYIQIHPEQFVSPENFDLVSLQAQVSAALRVITQNASTCANNIKNCQFPDVAIPTIVLPARKDGAPVVVATPPVPPPQTVQVPDVTSMSVAEAVQTLTQAGLETDIQPEDVSFLWYKLHTVHLLGAPDSTSKIIGTVPDAGAVENPGTIIIIRVPQHVIDHPDIALQ